MYYILLVEGQERLEMVSNDQVVVSKPDDVGSFLSVKIDPMNLKAVIHIIVSCNAIIRASFNFLSTEDLDLMASPSHFSSQVVGVDFSA